MQEVTQTVAVLYHYEFKLWKTGQDVEAGQKPHAHWEV